MNNELARGFKTWCERVAVQQRAELGLHEAAPLDSAAYAGHLDVLVWRSNEVPDLEPETRRVLFEAERESWSAATLTVGTTLLVILNHTHATTRQNSSLMHELAHVLLGHKPSRVDVTEDRLLILNTYDGRQEAEAEWLAGCLLRRSERGVQYQG